MGAIETLDPLRFYDYEEETGNTICGRYPIGVFLQVRVYIFAVNKMFSIDFFFVLVSKLPKISFSFNSTCNSCFFFVCNFTDKTVKHCAEKFTLRFQFYTQSSKAKKMTDSSVSYASASLTLAADKF
jgi:predicted class III extradiol MEMO1 family dioxygenase